MHVQQRELAHMTKDFNVLILQRLGQVTLQVRMSFERWRMRPQRPLKHLAQINAFSITIAMRVAPHVMCVPVHQQCRHHLVKPHA